MVQCTTELFWRDAADFFAPRRRNFRRSEHPQVLAGKLDPMLAAFERRRAMGAQRGLAEMEHVLPLVAEEHRGGELGLDAVLARSLRDAHTLEPDHARA